ncbi:pullulanase [Sediminitomix flava]|uniref:Pullulanase n=2 Tax=Sediminitomix flava TaxID=379075 RepID=A0A315Z7T5_SEDFL|nr:pullulanase [Sediminitomix flava]
MIGHVSCKKTENKPITYATFSDMPFYEKEDLGVTYNKRATTFKIWSPVAEKVKVIIYNKDIGGTAMEEDFLQQGADGVWFLVWEGDHEGKYYTYQLKVNGKWLDETPGIYAKAVGCNGHRGQIVDLKKTNPKGWSNDKGPVVKSPTDMIIYELHVRDMTIHPSSGSKFPGKYLGLAETGTITPDSSKTGIDHLKELGITHVHILPAFDYKSIDESKLDQPQFNWGYDPQNYNAPEGSYATDPHNGATRIKEFKEMVKAFHENGIGVIMDVVYNHTFDAGKSSFNQEVPKYYYRLNADSTYSDASACGNETASDLPMMRKYMVESIAYWAEEYHIDGFRFDLMGIHDVETMNDIAKKLKSINPSSFVYGEGWTASDSPLPIGERAIKANVPKLVNVAAFSDDMRDGVKGSWSGHKEKGFVSGKSGMDESVKFGIVASTQHEQIDYEKVNYSDTAWANEPTQTINYVSCHDNHTLYDKLKESNEKASEKQIKAMHKLANAIILTSQGVPFLHAGVEMLRTKYGVENSYNSPDSINQIHWDWKETNKDTFDYYKGLIEVRKAHPAFRMPTTAMIQKYLEFIPTKDDLLINYSIDGNANNDKASRILVFYNGSTRSKRVKVPKGKWKVIVNHEAANPDGIKDIKGGTHTINASSALILTQEEESK